MIYNSRIGNLGFSDQAQSMSYISSYFIDYHHTRDSTSKRYPILQIYYNDANNQQVFVHQSDISKVKDEDKKVVVIENSETYQINASLILNQKDDNKLNAILSIVRTTFLMFLLSTSSILFIKDINDLVLTPIEKMLVTVKRIAQNPLEAARMAEDEAVAEEEMFRLDRKHWRQQQITKLYETSILQQTILKIGTLLAVGFGEAGSEIIAHNMGRSTSFFAHALYHAHSGADNCLQFSLLPDYYQSQLPPNSLDFLINFYFFWLASRVVEGGAAIQLYRIINIFFLPCSSPTFLPGGCA